MTGASKPARLAAAERSAGRREDEERRTRSRLRSRQAASASSGPIPAGSPIVIASGGLSSVMLSSGFPNVQAVRAPTFALTSPSVRSTSWNIKVWLRVAGW